MIEEYISRLQEENKEKLNAYDKEMQDLTEDLSSTEKLLSQLEKEKMDEKNIFSPRNVDSGTDLEIQKAQDQIRLLKQRLEYVSQMVETEVKNREEYRKLAAEAETVRISNARGNDRELLEFLDSVCKKIQFSVSLINGNKNRCRSELKNIERMIRSYEDGLKSGENS